MVNFETWFTPHHARQIPEVTMAWLRHLWIVQDPIAVWVQAAPQLCLKTIEQAVQPSVNRLHMRETFANGRRYDMFPNAKGFQLTTSAKSIWKSRQRINAACVMDVRVDSDIATEQTTLTLTAHLRAFSVYNALWIPFSMIYLISGNPWPREVIWITLITLFALSWAAMRFSAAVDAAEMTYFIQKTFEDFQRVQPVNLPAPADSDVIRGGDFEVMWQRFVQAHRNEHAD